MDKTSFLNFIKTRKGQLIIASILCVIVVCIITFIVTSKKPAINEDSEAQSTSDEMPADRTVKDTLTIGSMRYRDACRLLPEKVIEKKLGASGDQTTSNELYTEQSIKSGDFYSDRPIETYCQYRSIGKEKGVVKVSIATYSSRNNAVAEWDYDASSKKEAKLNLFSDLQKKIESEKSLDQDKKSHTESILKTVYDTVNKSEPRSQDTKPVASNGSGILFDTMSKTFSVLKDNAIITVEVNRNTTGNDFSKIDELSPQQIVDRFDTIHDFLDSVTMRFDDTSLSQAPLNTWPRNKTIKGFEPCDIMSASVLSSAISPDQDKLVKQSTTSRDISLTRKINDGAYTFPSENSCTRTFNTSANGIWGGEATLTVYYPKDIAAGKKLFSDQAELYANTPSITLDGADQAIFKNRYDYNGTSLAGILFARKGQYVIKIQLSGTAENRQDMLYTDSQYIDVAKQVISKIN